MQVKEDLLRFDFQGWPIFRKNLKEILFALGGIEEDGKIVFSLDSTIMTEYPRILEEDGMGYGVDDSYISDVDVFTEKSEDENKDIIYINIFREPIPSNDEQHAAIERWDEEEKEVLRFKENFQANLDYLNRQKNREKL